METELEYAVCWGVPESDTFTTKVPVCAVVGVPLMTPELGFKVNPYGKEPVDTDQFT
jgi:hypothetical protein